MVAAGTRGGAGAVAVIAAPGNLNFVLMLLHAAPLSDWMSARPRWNQPAACAKREIGVPRCAPQSGELRTGPTGPTTSVRPWKPARESDACLAGAASLRR